MSFGVSVGDFIAVLRLANDIRKRFVDAPLQLKAISEDVKVLSNVLRDVDDVLPQRDLTSQQKSDLDEISQGCCSVLKSLEETLDKHKELDSSASISGRSRRVWKRFQWDQKDIDQFRSRIGLNINAFGTFLGRITSNVSFATKAGVDRLHERQDERERREEHRAILDWLTPIDFAPQQSDLIKRRQKGTGEWLLNSSEFQEWVNKNKQTLFCPGIPGAGKTMITSIVVEHLHSLDTASAKEERTGLQNDTSIGIAYLYCNFRRQLEQTPEDLLASLLKQLLQELSSIPEGMKNLYYRHKTRKTRPSFDKISKELQSVIVNYSRTFIIIDALDECQVSNGDRRRFLSEVFSLQAKTGASLFATSRFIPEVQKEFEGNITLEIRARDEDVQRYVSGKMPRLRSFILRNSALQEEIESGITKAVDGMFLLAQLYIDSLADKSTPRAIRDALKTFQIESNASDDDKTPKVLDHAYTQAMERINNQNPGLQELARKVLSWITCAKRPLTTSELKHALAVEIGASELDRENLPEIEDMVSVCAGLVTIDEESDVVRLVHYTTQEYFERTQITWFPDAQRDIAMTCVTYLSFNAFGNGFCSSTDEFKIRLLQNPLYVYASRNWGHHVRAASMGREQLVLDFLKNEAKLYASIQVIMAFDHLLDNYYFRPRVPKQMTGEHIAAYFGLVETTIALLENGHNLDFKDIYGRTPLSWAAGNGHEVMVKLLVEKGADLESKDEDGRTPLSDAAFNGHEMVTKLLLEKGAQLESKNNHDETPLSFAALNGHQTVVKLLLEKGAQLESKNKYGQTSLSYAELNGHETTVKLLLEKGAELESKDIYGRTPLSWAAGNGHEVMVKLLVEKGADLESKDEDDRTPLSWAAIWGHQTVVEILLEKGAELESKDKKYGQTPLSWAAMQGHEAVVELLLEKGADLNSKDNLERTPLTWAAARGRKNVVKLLLTKNNIDPNHTDKVGLTPQLLATKNGYLDVAKLLLEKCREDDIAIHDEDINISAHHAADYEYDRICDICVSSIPDTDIHYHCGVCLCGDFDICRECIADGYLCLDHSHSLAKRMFEDGILVEVSD